MQDILNSLYEIPNFTTYIAIVIAVLIVLFLLVLFLGKKDQKLEETKKLQKIELDTFKETSEPVKLEAVVTNELIDSKVEETMAIPVLETSELSSMEDTVIMPVVSELPEETTFDTIKDLTSVEPNFTPEVQIEKTPVMSMNNNYDINAMINSLTNGPEETVVTPEVEATEVELPRIKEEIKFEEVIPDENIVLPEFNFEDVISSISDEVKETPSVSSLELPKEEKVILPIIEEKEEMIMPEIKTEESIKKVVNTPIFSSVYVPKKEEEIIDLTSVTQIKKESTEEVESNASFNAIMGESYNIK